MRAITSVRAPTPALAPTEPPPGNILSRPAFRDGARQQGSPSVTPLLTQVAGVLFVVQNSIARRSLAWQVVSEGEQSSPVLTHTQV